MTKKRPNPFRGKWRIVSTEVWGADALDDFGPAYLLFEGERGGELYFIAISASVDYRVGMRDGSPIVEFSWAGDDEGSPISGRGWARLVPPGLVGRILIHEGDESEFSARRIPLRG
jgi:hypothetical protein